MSELNKLCVNIQQDFTETQKAQARANIGAQAQLTAGSNVSITNNVISATDTTYTAGQNVTITNNVISATAAPQEQADWAETDSSAVDYIKNKPAIPVVPSMKPLVAGSNVSIVEGTNDVTISATAAPQLQANWNETSTSSVQYIQNKPAIPTLPTMKPLVAGSNITITEGVSDVTIAASGGGNSVPDVTSADNAKVLTASYSGGVGSYSWQTPSIAGYATYNIDWSNPYTHSFTVTQEDINNGYFDGVLEFATQADVTAYIAMVTRVALGWDVWWAGGLATSRISSVEFSIGTSVDSTWRGLFSDNAPAHEFHKDWTMIPGYLLHTRYNRIRMRCNLTSSAEVGDVFQIEVTGLVEQLR